MAIEGPVAAMDAAGVDKAAIVWSTSYGYDSSYVCDAAARYLGRFAVVDSVDLITPNELAWIRRSMAWGLSGLRLFTGGSTSAFDPTGD